MSREIKLVLPEPIYKRIMDICRELRVTPQDILLRAIVKTLDEFEEVGRGGRR